MKKFNFKHDVWGKTGKALFASLLFILCFSVMSIEMSAQTRMSQTNRLDSNHPVSIEAGKLGITMADLGAWDDSRVISVFTQKLAGINTQSTDPVVILKGIYYRGVLSDVSHLDIAAEISAVEKLMVAARKLNNPAITNSVLLAVYNDATSTF